jgi:flagellar biosynthesis/type III secretory pathway chaperone
MRTFLLISLLSLLTLRAFAQQALLAENTDEIIHTGIPSAINNTEGANAFLEHIYEQTQALVAFQDSVTNLKMELETNLNWSADPEMQTKQKEYEDALEVCKQMLSTNKRLLNGHISLRAVDTL